MNLTGVGQNAVTVHQFRKTQLMHPRGGGMDPAQLLCDFELLGTKRPGNDDLSVAKIIFELVVAAQVHYFQLRDVVAQALRKPFGSFPHFEAMMEDDQKLHRTFEPLRSLRYTKQG